VGDHYRPGPAGVALAQFQEKEARFRIHLRYRVDAERSYYRALEALNALTRRSSARPPRITAAAASVGQSGASTPAAAPRARSHSAGQTEAAAPLSQAVVHVPVPSSSPAAPRPESPSARLRLVNGSSPIPSRARVEPSGAVIVNNRPSPPLPLSSAFRTRGDPSSLYSSQADLKS
jgi:hypothetical protein